MIKKLFRFISLSSLYSILLLGIGWMIRYFLIDSQTSLQDVLFWVGAAPIVLFSFSLVGDFIGRGNISYQLSRSVSSQSSNQRAIQDDNDQKSRVKSGLTWILAGLFVWLISYFV